MIYFDRNSLVGRPEENIWLLLEYRNGLKTDTLHDCPKKKSNIILPANSNENRNKQLEQIKFIQYFFHVPEVIDFLLIRPSFIVNNGLTV
jgi:hypothetical protein